MVEFKAVIADPKTGRCYSRDVSGHYANSLVGKRIGDEVDGIFVGLPGYKLVITGGTDRDGVPLRPDLPGPRRKRVLVTKSIGFKPKDKGVRRRKTFRGNTISPDTWQLNMKVIVHGPKSIEEAFKEKEEAK